MVGQHGAIPISPFLYQDGRGQTPLLKIKKFFYDFSSETQGWAGQSNKDLCWKTVT